MNPHEFRESQPVDRVDRIPPRALLEGLGRIYELVLVTDYDGSVLWMSNHLGELCGDADFHIGRDAQSILPRLPKLPHPEQVFTLRSQLRQDGCLSDVRVELATHDGDPVPVEVNILPVTVTDEDRPFFVVIARTLDDLRDEGHHGDLGDAALGAMLDRFPGSVLAVDERGFVNYANDGVLELLGHRRDEVLDRPVAALLSDAADVERLADSLGSSSACVDCELRLTRADGKEIHVVATARARKLVDEQEGGTVLSLHDVTRQTDAACELEHKNAELEHCVQALAHDLRSPLVALLGFSRLLRQDYGSLLDDTGVHFVDRIEQAGRTMEDLIHDLLELSRIGQPGERRTLVDLAPVLEQVHAELKPRLDAAGIQLDAPAGSPAMFCDRTRLYQVLVNLIGNAIDHMGACDDPRISVSVEGGEDCHQLSVSDAGRGIPAENRERVFDVFQSFGPTSDGRRGTGIGLAIVKKIAETHGGRVWVESRPGAGATFHVTFPRR